MPLINNKEDSSKNNRSWIDTFSKKTYRCPINILEIKNGLTFLITREMQTIRTMSMNALYYIDQRQ